MNTNTQSPSPQHVQAACERLTAFLVFAPSNAIADLDTILSALTSSQARIAELEGALNNPNAVHLNMLRGGIAKLTPAQIGHLYRGAEAAKVVDEVIRQNPDTRALLTPPHGEGQ